MIRASCVCGDVAFEADHIVGPCELPLQPLPQAQRLCFSWPPLAFAQPSFDLFAGVSSSGRRSSDSSRTSGFARRDS